MISPDLKGIEGYLKDPIIRKLYEEHRQLEKKLAKLEKKPFLTADEESEEHRLKKMKLAGKDQLVRLLEKCQKNFSR